MSVTLRQTPFSIHAAAYWAARRAYESHQVECQSALERNDPLQHDYDSAYAPLVAAMDDAARAAVNVPASSTAEIASKIDILLNESLHDLERSAVKEMFETIGADAKRLGGVA